MRRHRLDPACPPPRPTWAPASTRSRRRSRSQLELEVEETGEFEVRSDLDGLPLDRSNLCVRAFEALHPADGIRFEIRSEIPPAAGLGSSAAAIVAGLVAADHMYELDAPLFDLARELEGHPDNVAAALLGGFVICAEGEPVRFDPPPALEACWRDRRERCPRRRRAPRCPPRCRWPTRFTTWRTRRCSCSAWHTTTSRSWAVA